MLVLIMLTFSCHALCNCQGAREAEAPRGQSPGSRMLRQRAKRPGGPSRRDPKEIFVVSRRGSSRSTPPDTYVSP